MFVQDILKLLPTNSSVLQHFEKLSFTIKLKPKNKQKQSKYSLP